MFFLICWGMGISMCDFPPVSQNETFSGGRSRLQNRMSSSSPCPALLLLSQHLLPVAGSFAMRDLCAPLERGVSLNRKLISAYYIDYHSGIKLIL